MPCAASGLVKVAAERPKQGSNRVNYIQAGGPRLLLEKLSSVHFCVTDLL